MPSAASSRKILHVLVATPSGATGQGGIDRLMAMLKQELESRTDPDLDVRFAATRGSGHVALSVFVTIAFCLRMAWLRALSRVDVIHLNLSSHGSTYRKMAIAATARLLNIPYVLHLHGSRYQSFWTNNTDQKGKLIRQLFAHAARVVVLGSAWRDFVIARAPETAGRVIIIPNATPAPVRPRLGGGESVQILFLGRLGARKGVPELIAALGRLADLPGWRATIAGDGEVEEARADVSRLGLEDRVTVPGWAGPDEVADLLSRSDILALPSHAENLPVSVIEAMANGLAVVATPVGAVEDIVIPEQTGLLVDPGDVEALALALRRLVEDTELRMRLGRAAEEFHRAHLELGPFAEALIDVWRAAATGP